MGQKTAEENNTLMQVTLIVKHGVPNIPLHTVLSAFALKLTHRLGHTDALAEPPGATHFLPLSRGQFAVDALHNITDLGTTCSSLWHRR